MIPVVTAARLSGAKHRAELPVLVLGPSLGTSARSLWTASARHLTDAFDVLAWDLPGHGAQPDGAHRGASRWPSSRPGVLRVVDDVLAERGELNGSFGYAGVSVGGCVGLQLMRRRPDACLGRRPARHRCPHRQPRALDRADGPGRRSPGRR